jgi:hypothetical protein
VAVLIRPDAVLVEVHAAGKKWKLEELQAHVGGSIERLQVKGGNLIVNEEGQLLGLPANLIASYISGHNIVGNALLIPRGERW